MTDLHEEYLNVKKIMGNRLIDCRIDLSATLGEGSVVWWYSVILQRVRIGNRVSVGSRSEIGRDSIIGDDSRIGSGVFLPPNSRVGKKVFIGPNVTFTDDRDPYVHGPDDPPYTPEPPVIEDCAAIGAGAVVLPGVTIGHHALIGAGSIVTRDVPPHAVIRGEPARQRYLRSA